jgi:hypothetical protein
MTRIISTLKMEENMFFQNAGTKYKIARYYSSEDHDWNNYFHLTLRLMCNFLG